MQTTALTNHSIGELIAGDYRIPDLLRDFGIDFTYHDERSLEEACSEQQVTLEPVEEALKQLKTKGASSLESFREMELDDLVDHIVIYHHRYVRRKLPEIYSYSLKVAKALGEQYPQFKELSRRFIMMTREMYEHLDREEKVLFPYIRKLVRAHRDGHSSPKPRFSSVKEPISELQHDHVDNSANMADIRRLADDYKLPAEADKICKTLFQYLQAFEQQQKRHIFLENNILFPRARKLEKEFKSAKKKK